MEKLSYYIYCLIDPRDGNIFYVGKGLNNRVFHHAQASLQEKEKPSDKIALIREIHKSGNQPVYYTFYGTASKPATRLNNMKRWQ